MFLNDVFVTSATTGTGATITLGSAYDANFTTEEDKAVDGRAYTYVVQQGSDFAECIGVYTASGRTIGYNVIRSKISGVIGTTKITLNGTQTIRFTPLAEYLAAPSSHFGGRLTLTSATPVTGGDVTAATAIYATPFGVNAGRVHLYDGIGAWQPFRFSELTLTLDSNSGHTGYHQSGKNFDTFIASNSGTIVVGTGPAWSSDSARGTGAGTTELELFEGAYVNKNAITLRNGSNTYAIAARQALYVGSFRATADGQTEDSAAKRFLSNAFNEMQRPMLKTDATSTWTYSTNAWRQMRADATNQIAWLHGLPGRTVAATAQATVSNSTTTAQQVLNGCGLDSTTTPATGLTSNFFTVATNWISIRASYKGCPGIGYHFMTALEHGAGSDTQTWVGQNFNGVDGETVN
jgi:hypothetical protein